MATRIAWLLNLDATDELAGPARAARTKLDAARVRELRSLFHDLVAPTDIILDAGTPLSAADLADPSLLAQAFCPTPSALAAITASGLLAPPAPSLEVLRRVSDRGFCAELGHTLPGAAFAREMQTLERCLSHPSWTGTHVVKRAFSFAGRHQRRVRDGWLDESTRGFCARSFARGQGVQVEPWVQRVGDFSLHGYLSRSGTLLLGQAREQRCDAMGRFIGMTGQPAQLADDERAALVAELERAGKALHAAGYFGPFGIDGFRYVGPDGAARFNPRCEVNARFTMGYPRELLERALALG